MSTLSRWKSAVKQKSALAIALALCCGLLHGCGSPVAKNGERPTANGTDGPPDDPPPAPLYSARPSGRLSFNADIAPIVFRKCASCHRPGEIGPFPLLSYADFRKRARQIVAVTQSRIMPPWSAVPGYCVFEQDRGLSIEECGMIAQWTDEGSPEGSPSELPPLPKFTDGWRYGTPDLVVHLPEPYTLAA